MDVKEVISVLQEVVDAYAGRMYDRPNMRLLGLLPIEEQDDVMQDAMQLLTKLIGETK